MGEYLIKTITDAKDLDKGLASANKVVKTLGIDMTLSKPAAAKITAAMAKSKKADFKLICDKNVIKVVVDCKDYVNALALKDLKAAGVLDPKTQKAAEAAIALLDTLVTQGLKSKSEAEAQKAEIYKALKAKAPAAEKPSPKLAKVDADLATARKSLDALNAKIAGYAKLTGYASASQHADVLADLRVQAKKDGSIGNLDFLDAVAARQPAKALIANFVDAGRVHLDTSRIEEMRDNNISGAVDDIKEVVGLDTLRKMKVARAKDFAVEKARLESSIKALSAEREKLVRA